MAQAADGWRGCGANRRGPPDEDHVHSASEYRWRAGARDGMQHVRRPRPQGVRAVLRRLLLLQDVSQVLKVVDAGSVRGDTGPAPNAESRIRLPIEMPLCRVSDRRQPMRVNVIIGLAIVGLVVAAAPVRAHHSFAAEYDSNKPVTITGAVTK